MSQRALADTFSEWCRLARLVMSIPIGSVANEKRFSRMNAVKSTSRNSLQLPHLNDCLRIADSRYSYNNFPYDRAFEHWWVAKQRRGAAMAAPLR